MIFCDTVTVDREQAEREIVMIYKQISKGITTFIDNIKRFEVLEDTESKVRYGLQKDDGSDVTVGAFTEDDTPLRDGGFAAYLMNDNGRTIQRLR